MQLYLQNEMIKDEYRWRREYECLKEEIVQEVLKRISIMIETDGAIESIDSLTAALKRFQDAAHGKGR